MAMKKIPDEKIQEIHELANTMTLREISEKVGVSLNTAYNYAKEVKKKPVILVTQVPVKSINLIKDIRQLFRNIEAGEEIEVVISQGIRKPKGNKHTATVNQKSYKGHVLYVTLDTGSRYSISDYQVLTGEVKIRKVG